MRLVLVGILCALVGRADARTATGYSGGQKVKLKVVEVGDAEVEVHTAKAFRAMAKAARKAGVDLAIRSGWRSFEKQKRLYRKFRKGRGNLAARPGYSNHENGRALDLVVTREKTYSWLSAHAAEFGFHRTVRGEPWHWEYLGTAEPTSLERGYVATLAVMDENDMPCTRDWGFSQPPLPDDDSDDSN